MKQNTYNELCDLENFGILHGANQLFFDIMHYAKGKVRAYEEKISKQTAELQQVNGELVTARNSLELSREIMKGAKAGS